ncbi:TnsD family Tn7-like transposition protein [Pseudomonas capsici]|uniref:TnsD family Tn7-like transposition protein n=1 Tax=Pseudomonas capsici TaxID=2810614 RepID=UPI0021F0DE7E|nr:TnsD family Tn7-like transposition protein [Pseudomonas capsici]MCV4284710.1 TnsD family transposase [Pseudomonas capsici]
MEHKFHFFPEPFPDETLHSVLSRYVRLSGFCGAAKVVALPPWKGSFSDNVPFPCRLNELEQALPHGTGLAVARMIEEHTLLPYYQPFLSEIQLHQARYQMEFGNGAGLKLSMGLIASRLEHASCARFCSQCIAHDQAQLGAAYWHRVHQLPGVYVCPFHEVPLRVVEHRVFSQFRRRLMLPDDDAVRSCAYLLEIPSKKRSTLLDIAKCSNSLLQALAPPLNPINIRSSLLRAAADSGIAGSTHRLRLSHLASFMKSHFDLLSDYGEYQILAEHSQGSAPTWVTKLLRKPRHSHHPLKYIVLANALGIDIRDLLIDGLRPSVFSTQAELIDGQSPMLVTGVCGDLPVHARPVVGKFAGLRRLIWKDAQRGMSACEIAGKRGVSLATTYRTIRANPDGPERWKDSRFKRELELRRERLSRQYKDRFAHDCADYAWLYRNDRAWLTEQCNSSGSRRLGRKPSSVFVDLDPSLAAEIHGCANRLFSSPGKPVWVNRSRIGRELGSVARFEKQLGKLPMCAVALDQVCESRQQFHCRRLAWAKQQLLLDGVRVTKSRLYRLASIRMG